MKKNTRRYVLKLEWIVTMVPCTVVSITLEIHMKAMYRQRDRKKMVIALIQDQNLVCAAILKVTMQMMAEKLN
jgi:hypothetical protein